MKEAIPPITPHRFDVITSGPERIWGLDRIAEVLGVSVSKARRLARRPSVPIYRPDGWRYFAFRHELIEWMRSTHGAAGKKFRGTEGSLRSEPIKG